MKTQNISLLLPNKCLVTREQLPTSRGQGREDRSLMAEGPLRAASEDWPNLGSREMANPSVEERGPVEDQHSYTCVAPDTALFASPGNTFVSSRVD